MLDSEYAECSRFANLKQAPSVINHKKPFFLLQNALKLTYSNVESQNFFGGNTAKLLLGQEGEGENVRPPVLKICHHVWEHRPPKI